MFTKLHLSSLELNMGTTSLSQMHKSRTTWFPKYLYPESANLEWIITSPLSLVPGIHPLGVEFEAMAKSGLMQ